LLLIVLLNNGTKQVLDGLDRKLGQVIAPYTRSLLVVVMFCSCCVVVFILLLCSALAEGMPANWRAPLASYGTEGCFGFYELNLQELIAYPDLDLALQHFKGLFLLFRNCFFVTSRLFVAELGNGLVFLNMLEHAISRSVACRFVQAAPLLGLRPGAASSGASCIDRAVGKAVAALRQTPEAAVSPHVHTLFVLVVFILK
jgi:hypothetical protein